MKTLLVVILGVLAVPTWAAPISFNTALPVTQGEGIVRAQLIRRERNSPGAEVDISALALATGYGLNSRLAVFAAIPLMQKQLNPKQGTAKRTAQGLGDLSLFGRYTVWQQDGPGSTLRIAPLLGITVPTGQDAEHDRFGRLPRPLQTGAGSWAGMAGVVVTRQTLAWQWDGQLAYTHTGHDEGYRPGRRVALDLSGQWRIWPRSLGRGVPGFVYGVLESQWSDSTADQVGRKDTASGGSRWLLAPGLQYISQRWVVESAVQIPIVENLPVGALTDSYVARLSLRTNF